MRSLSQVVLTCFAMSLFVSLAAGGLISLVDRDLGIYLGLFLWGFSFSTFIDWFEMIPADDEYEDLIG